MLLKQNQQIKEKHTALRFQCNRYRIQFSQGGKLTDQALCLFMK